jgi:hypothetical protein
MWPRSSHDPRRNRDLLSRMQAALTPVTRPNVLVILWRWRYELGLLTGLPTAFVLLARAIGAGWTVLITVVILHVIALWPPARRLAIAEAWCVITPHRVRTGCAQAWIHSRQGKIPLVLLTKRQPWGESVLLLCRAGTTPQDFLPARPLLATACWARDVVVTPNEHHAQLVTLHVIRRDGWQRPSGPAGPDEEPTGPHTPPEPPTAGPWPDERWLFTGDDGEPRAA